MTLSMEKLGTHEYDIPLVRGGHLEGPHVFVFLSCGFSMDTLRTHEYDIPLDRGGHLEGPHVFRFLIYAFPSEIWSQTQKEIMGLEHSIFQSEMMQFRGI